MPKRLPCPDYPEKCEVAQRCHLILPMQCLFNEEMDNPDRRKNRRRCCVTEGIIDPNSEPNPFKKGGKDDVEMD